MDKVIEKTTKNKINVYFFPYFNINSKYIDYVLTAFLAKLVYVDDTFFTEEGRKYIQNLVERINKYGITTPVRLRYSLKDRSIGIYEGNFTVQVAIESGISYIPVTLELVGLHPVSIFPHQCKNILPLNNGFQFVLQQNDFSKITYGNIGIVNPRHIIPYNLVCPNNMIETLKNSGNL